MADDKFYHEPPADKSADATSLHEHANEVRERHALEREKEKQLAEKRNQRAYFEFMNRKFTDADLAAIEERTGEAVHAGKYEVEVVRFPSWYLTDHGRRINNNHADWPATLTGYAARLYEAYLDIGRPKGFRIKARVVDYPEGKIGTIALFICW